LEFTKENQSGDEVEVEISTVSHVKKLEDKLVNFGFGQAPQ